MNRGCPMIVCVMSVIWGIGCGPMVLAMYEPISIRTVVEQGVCIEVVNPSVRFTFDEAGLAPRQLPLDATEPTVADYLGTSLKAEFEASGYRVLEGPSCDVAVRIQVKQVALARAESVLLPPIVILRRQAMVVDVDVRAELPRVGRSFRRRFAKVEEDSFAFVFFVPIGFRSPSELLLETSQGCLSEIVREVTRLVESIERGT